MEKKKMWKKFCSLKNLETKSLKLKKFLKSWGKNYEIQKNARKNSEEERKVEKKILNGKKCLKRILKNSQRQKNTKKG